MRRLSSCILLYSIFALAGAASHGAAFITATNRLPNSVGGTFAIPFGRSGTEVPPAIRLAQTFTAAVGGRLLSASVTAASLNADPTGLQLAVTAVENGQ